MSELRHTPTGWLEALESDIDMLRQAIVACDPHAELRLRMDDIGGCLSKLTAALATPLPVETAVDETLQARVQPWMMSCFGREISSDRVERGDRLLEEVFELLQSGGYDPARILALRDYVWGREAGEPSQEVGGVMITLAAYCLAYDLNMHEAGEAELARIWTKVDKIRAKQAAKPVGSALPVAHPLPAVAEPGVVLRKAAEAIINWDDATLNDFIPTNLSKNLRAALEAGRSSLSGEAGE